MVQHTRQPECPGGNTYTIRSGDTFYSIARRFNVSLDALLEANPGVDPDNLSIGQVICIPGTGPQPKCPNGTLYTIRAGDTLFAIARRYNVSVDAILRANPGLDPDFLVVGRIICIPGVMPGECPSGSFAYTIRSGDTLYALAIEFNTTVSAIQRLNPGIDPNNLRVGMQICIPGEEPPEDECPPGSREYTIRSGDTFFRLAQRFGVSVDDIAAANPGVDPNRLVIGQVICIPQPDVPPCPGGRLYVIRPGDNLFAIARRNNITLARLIAANPQIEDPDNIAVGATICIPPATNMMAQQQRQCPTGTFAYVIRSGDTFYSLAQRFNTTANAIIRANPNVNPDNLRVGQTVCIPGTAPGPEPGRCPDGTFRYTIRSGDTFYSLAQRFNTTVGAIQDVNPDVDPNNLRVGQTICIPGTAPGPEPGRCPDGTFRYTVRSGDTFYSLAQRFNTTVREIQDVNPNVDPNSLRIGQNICIPGTAPGPQPGRCPAGTFAYTVRSGDTYFRLAQQYNTTVEAIRAANPNVNPNSLRIGQIICIPRR